MYPYYRKLFVYGTGDPDNAEQAERRFDDDERDGIHFMPVATVDEFMNEMDKLVKQNEQLFDRVLFQTHGRPGRIYFSDDDVPDSFMIYYSWRYCKDHKHYKLFPSVTRIYFDGCNVGADQKGKDFLVEAGQGLLYLAGGEVIAFDSPGYYFEFPFIGAQTRHVSGSVVRFAFKAGGVNLGQVEY